MEEKHIGILLARGDNEACRFGFSLARTLIPEIPRLRSE